MDGELKAWREKAQLSRMGRDELRNKIAIATQWMGGAVMGITADMLWRDSGHDVDFMGMTMTAEDVAGGLFGIGLLIYAISAYARHVNNAEHQAHFPLSEPYIRDNHKIVDLLLPDPRKLLQ